MVGVGRYCRWKGSKFRGSHGRNLVDATSDGAIVGCSTASLLKDFDDALKHQEQFQIYACPVTKGPKFQHYAPPPIMDLIKCRL